MPRNARCINACDDARVDGNELGNGDVDLVNPLCLLLKAGDHPVRVLPSCCFGQLRVNRYALTKRNRTNGRCGRNERKYTRVNERKESSPVRFTRVPFLPSFLLFLCRISKIHLLRFTSSRCNWNEFKLMSHYALRTRIEFRSRTANRPHQPIKAK